MTLGEYRVGISFNPGGNEDVGRLKRGAADLIDLCASIRASSPVSSRANGEVQRLWALAMTNIEDGAMWAVKAVTKPEM